MLRKIERTQIGDASMSGEARNFFDARRQALLTALLERNAELASYYRAAICELARGPVPPEDHVAHVSAVCHSMRELMAGLPGVVSDDVRPRSGESSKDLLLKLPRIAAEFPNLDLNSELQDVPVPSKLAKAMHGIILASDGASGRNRAKVRLLLTGSPEIDSKQVKEWMILYKDFFVHFAHWDRGSRQHDLPSDKTLETNIRRIEDLMSPRVQQFIDQRPGVFAMLEEINTPLEDGTNS